MPRVHATRLARLAAMTLAMLGLGSLLPARARAVSAPPGFVVENAFPGNTFFLPVQVVFMPDGRKLVVEQQGTIWVVMPDGTKLPGYFVNLAAKVLGTAGRGMLGVALDPDFATNRWVYLSYTVDPDSDGTDNIDEAYARVERYRVSAIDPNAIDLSTRQVLIGPDWASGIPCADGYHSIGSLRFAADKTLLVASGESAHFDATDSGGLDAFQFLPGRTNPAEDIGSFRALTLNSFGGKILRIDKETGHGVPSNPFWDGNPLSKRSRVWEYGLRNPYRFTIKPATGATDPSLGQPGTLYIGNTGWNTYESVLVGKTGGLSFGWPCYEGPVAQPLYVAVTSTQAGNANVLCSAPPSVENPVPSFTPPLVWWHHSDGTQSNPPSWVGHAAIGGNFHRGSSYPSPYAGAYYMADFVDGWVRWIQTSATDNVTASGTFIEGGDGPVDIEWDPDTGDLFYVARTAGEVRRIRYVPSQAVVMSVRADSANGSAPYAIPGAGSPWVDVAGSHDMTLANFDGTASSGWQGTGTSLSPYRLQFDGVDDHVTLPAGSIPELQSPAGATASMWIRTGADVSSGQFLVEWLEQFANPYAGMSVALLGGQLRVFVDVWRDVAPVEPNTWYHVAVAKDVSTIRVFVNGALAYSGTTPKLGSQNSEIVLGASTWRGAGVYGDYYRGAIAQFHVWPVSLSDLEILASYQASLGLYFSTGSRVVFTRADSALGTGPPAVPGAATPWHDLVAGHDATLSNFAGTQTSGWQGDGSKLSPYRLVFDGVDDRVTIPAGSVPELQSPTGVTISMWVRTGVDIVRRQYLFEWLSQYTYPYPGVQLAIDNRRFRVFNGSWADVADVEPNTWYFFTVTKTASSVSAYVNESKHFSSGTPDFGGQTSEIVLGASTFRGASIYGDYFKGSIAQAIVWRRALIDPEVQEIFHESEGLYLTPPPLSAKILTARADSASGTGRYAIPGAQSPWMDLVGANDLALSGFAGTSSSGWLGDGSAGSPYRLEFDGVDDRATVTSGAVVPLQNPSAATVALWFRTGADTSRTQYLLQWLSQYTSPYPGMTLAVEHGHVRALLDTWVDLAPVAPNSWYHVALAKEPSSALGFVNGELWYSSTSPNLGGQASKIVLGASTYRGVNKYGEQLQGAISSVSIWPGGLSPGAVRQVYRADSALYALPPLIDVGDSLPGTFALSARPNPFQGTVDFGFVLERAGYVTLDIFDVDGRRVRSLLHANTEPGATSVRWDGRDQGGRLVRPGVFFAHLVTPGAQTIRRVVRLN